MMAMDAHDWSLRFQRDGYVVQRSLISQDDCKGILAQVMSDWRMPERNLHVHKKKFRIHATSEWNELTLCAVNKLISGSLC